MNRTMRQICIAAILLLSGGAVAHAQSVRIKDIAAIEGVRANQLLGYGLVIGLDGTGDSQQTKFTAQSVANMLETYGMSIEGDKMKVKNVAAVMVTATLPSFARQGSTLDVVVSSLGDARSLQGGTLLQTPLRAANGEVYAVAQGPVTVGGFSVGGGGASASKNHVTVGRVPGGAIVEKTTKTDLAPQDSLNVTLTRADFTTAARAAEAINLRLGGHFAKAVDSATVTVGVPAEFQGDVVSLIAQLESAEVTTDTAARIVVNERTGTVIIGASVRIQPVAVSHGALTVEVATNYAVSQPKPLSQGTTVATPVTDVTAREETASLVEVKGATVAELVRALNALKVSPRDLIAILQAIKEAGALQAQLEII